MDRTTALLIAHDVVPALRMLLREAAELRGAVQLLAGRVEALTTELADGAVRAGKARGRGRAGARHQERRRAVMNRVVLERPFEPGQIRQRRGRNGLLDYVEGWSVIQRLNEGSMGPGRSRSRTRRCATTRWSSSAGWTPRG